MAQILQFPRRPLLEEEILATLERVFPPDVLSADESKEVAQRFIAVLERFEQPFSVTAPPLTLPPGVTQEFLDGLNAHGNSIGELVKRQLVSRFIAEMLRLELEIVQLKRRF